jgi:hypothetical protein
MGFVYDLRMFPVDISGRSQFHLFLVLSNGERLHPFLRASLGHYSCPPAGRLRQPAYKVPTHRDPMKYKVNIEGWKELP